MSYAIWKEYCKTKDTINIDNLVLDSGAFSVYNSGKVLDINDFISVAKESNADEIFALDKIGDYGQSQANTIKMWNAGIKAIPVYHIGEPVSYLDWCCKYTPVQKIALGSSAKSRMIWLNQQFKYVWDKYGPTKIHGFGMASFKAVDSFPFDSVDASSWATAAGRFGQYAGFTGTQIHLKSKMRKGVFSDLWVEVLEHQRREKHSEFKWRYELNKMPNRTGGCMFKP